MFGQGLHVLQYQQYMYTIVIECTVQSKLTNVDSYAKHTVFCYEQISSKRFNVMVVNYLEKY
jgi:hypothetical protein